MKQDFCWRCWTRWQFPEPETWQVAFSRSSCKDMVNPADLRDESSKIRISILAPIPVEGRNSSLLKGNDRISMVKKKGDRLKAVGTVYLPWSEVKIGIGDRPRWTVAHCPRRWQPQFQPNWNHSVRPKIEILLWSSVCESSKRRQKDLVGQLVGWSCNFKHFTSPKRHLRSTPHLLLKYYPNPYRPYS